MWLTSTDGVDEADASIARWQPDGDATEQYVVGWAEAGAAHQLARIDAAGNLLEGPVDVSSKAAWGRRDDPFRAHVNQDVIWAWFDEAGSSELRIARVGSGATTSCASF